MRADSSDELQARIDSLTSKNSSLMKELEYYKSMLLCIGLLQFFRVFVFVMVCISNDSFCTFPKILFRCINETVFLGRGSGCSVAAMRPPSWQRRDATPAENWRRVAPPSKKSMFSRFGHFQHFKICSHLFDVFGCFGLPDFIQEKC